MDFLEDAYHFARENQHVANLAPLQLYASGLVFAPRFSQVKTSFTSCMPRWLIHPPRVADIWDHDILTLEGHTGEITAIAFSLDDEYLATCSYDNSLRIWKVPTGECVSAFSTGQNLVAVAIAFSSSGSRIAVASVEHSDNNRKHAFSVTIYDAQTGIEFQRVGRNSFGSSLLGSNSFSTSNTLRCLAFAPGSNDTLSIVTLVDGILETWRAGIQSNVCERLRHIDPESQPAQMYRFTNRGLAISTDISRVLCRSSDGRSIQSFDLESGDSSRRAHELHEYSSGVLATYGTDLIYETASDEMQSLKKFGAKTSPVMCFTQPRAAPYTIFAVAHASEKVAYGSQVPELSGAVRVCSMSNTPVESQEQPKSPPIQIEFTLDGEKILVVYSNRLDLLDIKGNVIFKSPEVEFPFGAVFVFQVAMTSDGGTIVAQLVDEIRVWYVKSGEALFIPDIGSQQIMQPAISNDGKLVPYCSRKRLTVRHLEQNRESWSFDTSIFKTTDIPTTWTYVSFSKDDKTLFTNLGNLDLDTGRRTEELGHQVRLREVQRGPLGLSEDKHGIQSHRDDLLWLPPQYRPLMDPMKEPCSTAQDGVAILCEDDRVISMRLVDPRSL
jgi:WD40 repeat protein